MGRLGRGRKPPPVMEPFGDEPVVCRLALRGSPLAAVAVATVEEDSTLSRRLVVLEFRDRSCFRPSHARTSENAEWGTTLFHYPITGRFPKALPTVGR
jgi:hypothetical protein